MPSDLLTVVFCFPLLPPIYIIRSAAHLCRSVARIRLYFIKYGTSLLLSIHVSNLFFHHRAVIFYEMVWFVLSLVLEIACLTLPKIATFSRQIVPFDGCAKIKDPENACVLYQTGCIAQTS